MAGRSRICSARLRLNILKTAQDSVLDVSGSSTCGKSPSCYDGYT